MLFTLMKDICRGTTGSHCIEGQLSGKSTLTNVGPFPPLSSAPPSGPLLVSFSPADISVMTLSEPHGLCVRAFPGLDAGPVPLNGSLPEMSRVFIRPRNVNNDDSSSWRIPLLLRWFCSSGCFCLYEGLLFASIGALLGLFCLEVG